MFKVTTDGREFSFGFKYSMDEHRDYGGRRKITCYIKDVDDVTISQGFSICDGRDQFCKETGRKRAFTKALMFLTNELPNAKLVRTAFWSVYLNRKNIMQKNTISIRVV